MRGILQNPKKGQWGDNQISVEERVQGKLLRYYSSVSKTGKKFSLVNSNPSVYDQVKSLVKLIIAVHRILAAVGKIHNQFELRYMNKQLDLHY